MEFKYCMQKEDYKKIFEKPLKRSCIFFFFFFTLLFGIIEFYLFQENLVIGFCYYTLTLFIFLIVLLILEKMYLKYMVTRQLKKAKKQNETILCKLDEIGIHELFTKETYSLKWDSLKKITVTPNIILFLPRKNQIPILLQKSHFENLEHFEQVKLKLKEYVK